MQVLNSQSQLTFAKLEGCGNHFIVYHDTSENIKKITAKYISVLSDPHFGIGADGVLIIHPASSGSYDFSVAMFNPDGSKMGMCGNGIRCVARYVESNKLSLNKKLRFEVEGRAIECVFVGENIQVNMGAPIFDPALIPIASDSEAVEYPLMTQYGTFPLTTVSMGNPHAVIFVEDISKVELQKFGSEIEHHPFFPKRVNVEFVKVHSADALEVLVWERGAGATLACGTGACAALVAAVKTGRSNRSAVVKLPGGSLTVAYTDIVTLTGPARLIYNGTYSKG